MPIISSNIASLNTQAGLQRTNASISNSISRLSANLRVNTSEPVLPQKASNALAISMQETITKTQVEDGNLNQANNVLTRMNELVHTAANNTISAADRDAINQELSGLKGELKNISGSTSSDVLRKSYDGGNGSSYSVLSSVGQGSREISVSQSTTADDYAGMLTALSSARDGVSAASASNGAAMTAASKSYTDSLLKQSSSLAVREIPQIDTSELLALATSARDMLAAGRLAIANAVSSQSMNLASAVLRF